MQTPINKNDFVAVVGASNLTLPPEIRYISVYDLESTEPNYICEKKYLVAQLLHVKYGNNDSLAMSPTSSFSRGRYGSTMYNKKVKTSQGYKRLFFFLDLSTRGKCFAIFEKDRYDEDMYWQDIYSRANTRVGDIYLITEPHRIEHEINGQLGVVKTLGAFVAIQRPTTLRNFFPVIPDTDAYVGFSLVAKQVVFQNIICINTECNGQFCDRLYPKAKPCGCYTNECRTYGANHVLQIEVFFETGTTRTEKEHCVSSSLRVSELLFNKPVPPSVSRKNFMLPKINEIREAMRGIVTYINQHGGWSIAGWCRPTLSSEAGTDDQVISETKGFHISYLQPTDMSILEKDEFKGIQKDPLEFLLA